MLGLHLYKFARGFDSLFFYIKGKDKAGIMNTIHISGDKQLFSHYCVSVMKDKGTGATTGT